MTPLRTWMLALLLTACTSSPVSEPTAPIPPAPTTPVTTPPLDEAAQKQKAVQGVHGTLLADVVALAKAAEELQAAAPVTVGRGWDKTADAAAVAAMRAAWLRARTAYEHIEGALAPLFPDIDVSIDARYDDFLADLAAKRGDPYLFDADGVIGMHAVERVLYADTIPERVVTFEKALAGYVPAAMPATEQEAADFKSKLCAKLVTDMKRLLSEWAPAKIDVRIAYAGLISLVKEQHEKVAKASTGEEESRYSQRTMSDLRDNLVGTQKVYAIFKPWIVSKANGGVEIDRAVASGLASLEAAYAAVDGPAIPEPPATWSAEAPSAADLQTPFGKLYSAVFKQSDPTKADSVVSRLDAGGVLLGFPRSN